MAFLATITAGFRRALVGADPGRRGRPGSVRARLDALRASYDAARNSHENDRHWRNADNLSANAAASPEVRAKVRNRARYEVANNSYARGIVCTLANDCIGTGPKLQLTTKDKAANRQVEREFHRWAAAVRLAEKLRAMRMAKIVDGEAFGLLVTNDAVLHEVKLDLRLVECDRITTPNLRLQPGRVDGIEFDEAGNPVRYHMLRQHPGDLMSLGALGQVDNLAADKVIHLFRVDRPEQARGVSEIAPALSLFALLRRYTLATVVAAEQVAIKGGVIYTDAPADVDDGSDAVPFEEVELERGSFTTLPKGYKMEQIRAEQPTDTYPEFKHEVLNEVARCISVPFNIAAGNSSNYNYASGRLDHQVYYGALGIERGDFELRALDRIFREWFAEATRVGIAGGAVRDFIDPPHRWMWPGLRHVDPVKEAEAQQMRLASRTTTYAAEYAEAGVDWEDAFDQIALEQQAAADRGIALPSPDAAKSGSKDRGQRADQEEETRAAA